MRFWDELQVALALPSPPEDAIRSLQRATTPVCRSYARSSLAGPMGYLHRQWGCTALDPEGVINSKQPATTTFFRRWTGAGRLVALFHHAVYEVAFMLYFFMSEACQYLYDTSRQATHACFIRQMLLSRRFGCHSD